MALERTMRRKAGRWAGALWLTVLLAGAGAAQAADRASFSAYIDDLPIMPGLVENDQGYAVDLSEGGRLAEARLSGAADASSVRRFYSATLLQLGWRASAGDPSLFHRGGERLTFRLEPGGRPAARALEAVFAIAPDAEEAAP